MTQILFFALKDDLLALFEIIENKGPLFYMRSDKKYLTPKFDVYGRGSEIPNLGIATCESAIACDTYLVYESGASIQARVIGEASKTPSYLIDQLVNPDTITFSFGGIWKGETVLYGRVATVSASFSKSAKHLMSRFQSAIRKQFTKIHACYVGPNALELLKAGNRFTIAEQSPREFDLTLP